MSTTTTTADAETAIACLESWVSGDFERTRALLADDVTFTGPLGATVGGDEYVEGVRHLSEIVRSVEIHAVTHNDEGDVAVLYDLVTKPAGPLPTVGWYEVRDGRVCSVRAFFDPRPLLGEDGGSD